MSLKGNGKAFLHHSQLTLASSYRHRWAAKEAAYKALFPSLRLRWSDLHLVKDNGAQASPKPRLVFSDEFRDRTENQASDGIKMHLSISHDGDYIAAFVVAESPMYETAG